MRSPKSLVRRAERAGYQAIVVTLDSVLLGWRPADLSRAYLPFLEGTGIAQFVTDPVFRSALERPPEEDLQAAVGALGAVDQQDRDLGRPRVPAIADVAADPAEGHPASRRRARGPRARRSTA